MSDSITENLTQLSIDKTNIQNALITKGITNANEHGFNDFAGDINNIQNSYSLLDEGKVVSNGALISQTAYPTTITENGTYDTTTNNEVTIEISGGQKGAASLISSPKTGLYLSQSSIFVYDNKIELLFVVNYGGYGVNLYSGSFVFDISGLNLPKQNYTCESYYGAILSDSTNNWVTYGNFTSAIYNNDILTLTITTSSARLYKPIVFQLTLE